MRHKTFVRPIRLPSEAYIDPDRLFHLVVRSVPGTSPFVGDVGEMVWRAVMEERTRSSVVIVAACLMPDHLHVLARPCDVAIPRWIQSFKSYTTWLARCSGHGHRLWQPRFFDRAVRQHEVEAVVAYIARNPEAAGIVEDGGEWPWLWLGGDDPRG